MRKYLLPFFFFFTLFCSVAEAQQILFEQKQNKNIALHASDFPDASRVIFQKLAEGQNRPVSSIEITVTFEQVARVVRTNATHIVTSVEGKNFQVSGDVFYKGFDLATFLVPDEMSFSTSLAAGGKDSPPVSDRDRVKIVNGNSDRAENTFTDSLNSHWQFTVSQHAFSFTNTTLNEFKDQVALISNYYVASAEIETLHQRLMTVNPGDFDRLDFQNENLRTTESAIARIEAMELEQNLGLSSFDPLKFRPRFDELRNEAIAKRNAINQEKARLYIHFYNAALDLQARGKKQQARTYFSKSLHENPLFAPAAYQLALLDFEEGNYAGADEQGSDIVTRMNPDPDIRQLTHQLLNKTYRQYLAEAEQFNTQKKYSEALTVLDRASRLCRKVTGIPCQPSMDVQYRKAHNGKYQEILDKSRKAYQENSLSKAEEFVTEALNYQNRHQAEIPNAGDALAMQKGIRQKRYDTLVDAGKTQLKQQQYSRALDAFDDADDLQERYTLNPHPEIESLERQAAKPYLLSRIKEGKALSGANNLGEARKLSKEIQSVQEHYGLSEDATINKEYGELKANIFSQECYNAQKDFDRMHNQMQEAIRNKKYVDADQYYRNADKVLQDYADCSLNSGNLRAEHDSIIPAYVYQSLMNEVLSEQTAGRYKEAYSKYKDADTYYHRYEVTRFGLNHPPLADYAIEKCNNEFLLFLGNNFRSRQEYESSLQVYKALLERGVASKYFKDPLYQLGMEMAIRDKKLNPSADAKKSALAYTSGDSRLKKFYKGFLKGWKKKS